MTKDYLNSDKPYKAIVYPALVKVFGEKQFPIKEYALVRLEEILTGETYVATGGNKAGETIEKNAWKVVAKFDNEAAWKAAEKEYFSRFTTGTNGATPESGVITFGADMVNGGMSLPALKRLLGHDNIATTLQYVNLNADDVREEFLRAVRRRDSGVDA